MSLVNVGCEVHCVLNENDKMKNKNWLENTKDFLSASNISRFLLKYFVITNVLHQCDVSVTSPNMS